MTRTQKDVVSYFPHDADACTGDTLTVLQSRFGNDGYAFWFKLLEKLSYTDGHCLDCSNSNKWHLLLAKTGVDEKIGVDIMKLLVEMQAIDKDLWDSKLIWCQKLVDNFKNIYVNRRRELPQKPLITNKKGKTTGKKVLTTDESTQSRVKKSRVDKTIDYRNKEKTITTESFEVFWKAYPKKKSKGDAERAFKKVNPGEQLLTTMLATIERAKKSVDWQKDDGQYIPHPATWLNAKGWEDEYLEKGGAGKLPDTKQLREEWGQ